MGAFVIPMLSDSGDLGELIRPQRFLPVVDWPHTQKAFAFGAFNLNSGNSNPDLTRGNYNTGWVAYMLENGSTYLQKKLVNGLWDNNPRHLLDLVGGTKKISLEFSPSGTVIIGFIRPTAEMGIWWRHPDTGMPALLDLGVYVQDILLTVENKDDPINTDIFLWYFEDGALYMRNYKSRFAVVHGSFVENVESPVIIQAGINHRFGYQVDYRSKAEGL